jgi:hypothetical protein
LEPALKPALNYDLSRSVEHEIAFSNEKRRTSPGKFEQDERFFGLISQSTEIPFLIRYFR